MYMYVEMDMQLFVGASIQVQYIDMYIFREQPTCLHMPICVNIYVNIFVAWVI